MYLFIDETPEPRRESKPITIGGRLRLMKNPADRKYRARIDPKMRKAVKDSGCGRVLPVHPKKVPVVAYIVYVLPAPRSMKFKEGEPYIIRTVSPDCDNMCKHIFDSMNRLVYNDDSQVVKEEIYKVFCQYDDLRIGTHVIVQAAVEADIIDRVMSIIAGVAPE